MSYQVNTFIFIKPLKKRGKIREINEQEVTVSFWVGDNQLRKQTFTLDQIEPLRPKRQQKPLEIKVKYHDNELPQIEKIPHGDWVDLRAAEDVEMKQGDFKLISLGVSMQLPKGYEAHVLPRSSTFKTWGIILANSQGVIDESFCGTDDIWRFPAIAMRDTVIKKGDRICQFRVVKKMPEISFTEVDELNNPNRGGIGSTGTK